MKKITLPSGTYAVDDQLQEFDIIEKPSSNVAFIGIDISTSRMYVQFKNGSGYMYTEVDLDTLSFAPAAESIGKFISQKVVKHFTSEKMEKQLIIQDSYDIENQIQNRLFRKGQSTEITEITGFEKEPEF